MTPLEIQEAQRVFGDAINYKHVRIDEDSWIARVGAKNARATQMGVCTFYTINFTRKIHTDIGNADMNWLIHELVHVMQMKYTGSQYMIEAIFAQMTDGYNYGGPQNLYGKHYRQFNREQQGNIAQHYYHFCLFLRPSRLYGEMPIDAYLPLIDEMRAGDL